MKYFPLSEAQKRIWYSQKKYKESPLYNIGGTVKILGTIELASLKQEIEFVYWNNDALRLRYLEKDNKILQYISEENFYVFAVFRIDANLMGYFIKIHHINADGWSIKLLTEQVKTAYEQIIHEKNVSVERKPSYLDYVKREEQYLISEACKTAGEYWKRKFSVLP